MAKKIKHSWISKSEQTGKKTCVELLGAPDDRGVLNVGGRLGANRGPDSIRKILGELSSGIEDALSKIQILKGTDISRGASIEATHDALRTSVSGSVKDGVFPIVLGGGHDFGFPHLAGVSDALKKPVACINVDAHLDVRKIENGVITSGAPFRMALESGVLSAKDFIEFGIQTHCNTKEYADYVRSKKARIMMLAECRKAPGVAAKFEALVKDFSKKKKPLVVSFDVDAVEMASAPGVSAPQAEGFTAAEFLAMAAICGRYPIVKSIGFFEYAPDLDHGQMTGRLVATAIHRYMTELATR